MQTYYVIKVRKKICGKRDSRHIVGVVTDDNQFHPNARVVQSIKAQNKWMTWVHGVPPATVKELDRCPHCTHGPYLTTDADRTAKNNLENLPLDDESDR